MVAKKPSLVGQQFRSAYADANALWEVKKSRGRDVYECVIVNEPFVFEGKSIDGDYAGVKKVFSGADIRHAVVIAEHFRSVMSDHEAFYATLQVGQIIHYHDGFGQFVRCEVVELTEPTLVGFDEIPVGTKVLKQLALVGAWRSYDLKSEGYHAKQIREGKLMMPNASNLYENPKAAFTDPDPRQMPACLFEGQTDLFASV